ncbi:MAG: S-layer homology domain-containing protein [Clostridia bacterium]|nr:S-layer homology domain-containing protein [Clostridia bacterium]
MKKIFSLLLCLLMLVGMVLPALAADSDTVSDVAAYVYKTVSEPQVGAVGGEWAILGLARGGADIPSEYYADYYANVEEYVKAREGVLHTKKYTEYSRVVLALTAIGKDPANVAGYDLLAPLGDFDKTIWQGINGAIFALLALDSGEYESALREKYVDYILQKQLADGGWALSGESVDADVTAMALQALAKYTDKASVKTAVEDALICLSEMQNASGGFSTYGEQTAESSAQVIVALCELGISLDDTRFVKNGNTVPDNLMTYSVSGEGFRHTLGGGTNQMTTEQCLYALVAAERAASGKNSLYRMGDAQDLAGDAAGLAGKHADVTVKSFVAAKTFADITGHNNQAAIEALASRKIINGKTEISFDPDATMTRAEFATIVVNALGLPQQSQAAFADVTDSDWYYGYINTAYAYGIIKGVSDTEFNPSGTITREEAAVMVARAAKLCGVSTDYTAYEARNVLAGFSDYVKASEWAYSSLAFCYDKGILDDSVLSIQPKESVTRGEIAQMLYNMLSLSKLL